MTLQTFAEFERQLPSDTVCRVHKSYMVAVNRIGSEPPLTTSRR